jgi:hypothetical protein
MSDRYTYTADCYTMLTQYEVFDNVTGREYLFHFRHGAWDLYRLPLDNDSVDHPLAEGWSDSGSGGEMPLGGWR